MAEAPAAEAPTSGRRRGRAVAPNGTAQDDGTHDGADAHDGAPTHDDAHDGATAHDGAHDGSSPPLRGEEAAELAQARAAAMDDFQAFQARERFARAQSQSQRGAHAAQGSSRYDRPPERLPNDETQLANNGGYNGGHDGGYNGGAADGPADVTAAASHVSVALDDDVAAARANGALTPLRRNSSSVAFDLSRVGSSGGLRLQGGALVDEVKDVSPWFHSLLIAS